MTIKNSALSLLATAAIGMPGLVMAHPGHDHAHWLSNPIHLLTAVAIVTVVGSVFYILRKKRWSKK